MSPTTTSSTETGPRAVSIRAPESKQGERVPVTGALSVMAPGRVPLEV